jgi:hypothetical protein
MLFFDVLPLFRENRGDRSSKLYGALPPAQVQVLIAAGIDCTNAAQLMKARQGG